MYGQVFQVFSVVPMPWLPVVYIARARSPHAVAAIRRRPSVGTPLRFSANGTGLGREVLCSSLRPPVASTLRLSATIDVLGTQYRTLVSGTSSRVV